MKTLELLKESEEVHCHNKRTLRFFIKPNKQLKKVRVFESSKTPKLTRFYKTTKHVTNVPQTLLPNKMRSPMYNFITIP